MKWTCSETSEDICEHTDCYQKYQNHAKSNSKVDLETLSRSHVIH